MKRLENLWKYSASFECKTQSELRMCFLCSLVHHHHHHQYEYIWIIVQGPLESAAMLHSNVTKIDARKLLIQRKWISKHPVTYVDFLFIFSVSFMFFVFLSFHSAFSLFFILYVKISTLFVTLYISRFCNFAFFNSHNRMKNV